MPQVCVYLRSIPADGGESFEWAESAGSGLMLRAGGIGKFGSVKKTK